MWKMFFPCSLFPLLISFRPIGLTDGHFWLFDQMQVTINGRISCFKVDRKSVTLYGARTADCNLNLFSRNAR